MSLKVFDGNCRVKQFLSLQIELRLGGVYFIPLFANMLSLIDLSIKLNGVLPSYHLSRINEQLVDNHLSI